MTNEMFDRVYYPKYRSVIRAIARKLSWGDMTLFEDLIQEGLIKLWKLDPRKAKDNEDAYIRRAIQLGMIDYVRKMAPDRRVSLDQILESGGQLERDANGNLHIIPPEDASPELRRFD